jgi:glucose/arabinose dehydrogenase
MLALTFASAAVVSCAPHKTVDAKDSAQWTPSTSVVPTSQASAGLFTNEKLVHYYYDPAKLPAPFSTRSVDNGPRVEGRPDDTKLHVPPGFAIAEFASGLPGPRKMAVAPNGDVFVAESGPGRVVVLRDTKHTGKADVVETFADHLELPYGLAFYPPGKNPKYLYVGNTNSIVRFPYHAGDLHAVGAPEKLADLPGNGYHGHWTRNLLFSKDGKTLYVSVGSAGNVETGEDPRRAAILTFNPDGTGMQIFASGLRNPIGTAWNPATGALWASVNERDDMGDDLPNDYTTSVKQGGFYGWPNYYTGPNHDARMPENPELKARVITPDVLLEPHCAALSVTFYTASQFPQAYRNDAFVAMHGSWNRATRTGYKVVRIPMKPDGTPAGGYDDFAWGWSTSSGQVWGRPVDTEVASDGSLLISDDGAGKIWRVWYTGNKGR